MGGAGHPRRPRARHGHRRAGLRSGVGRRLRRAAAAHHAAGCAGRCACTSSPSRPRRAGRRLRARPPAPSSRPRLSPGRRRRSSRARRGGPTRCRRARRPTTAWSRWPSCTTRSPPTTTHPTSRRSMVLAIAKYHRDTNGWNDIGYNFLVDQYGQVFEGRAGGVEQAVVGAHAQGYNSQSTGVAVLGTFSDVAIPEAAMASITQLLGWKLSLHGVPCEGGLTIVSGGGSLNRYPSGTPVALQRISGHRDGDSTECPGNALYAQLPELRGRAAALAGTIVAHGRGQPAVLRRRDRLRRRRGLQGHGHPPRLDRRRRRGRRAAEARHRRRLGDGRRAPRRWSTARGSCACRGDAAATCAPWPPGWRRRRSWCRSRRR